MAFVIAALEVLEVWRDQRGSARAHGAALRQRIVCALEFVGATGVGSARTVRRRAAGRIAEGPAVPFQDVLVFNIGWPAHP